MDGEDRQRHNTSKTSPHCLVVGAGFWYGADTVALLRPMGKAWTSPASEEITVKNHLIFGDMALFEQIAVKNGLISVR
ncbi:hypothetical protein J53TS2_04960 [Paenibacillus sp. J53TS2]|nr:hypothetical protein J53TS2_04960 [Paenibacillus sp. J53TS2]